MKIIEENENKVWGFINKPKCWDLGVGRRETGSKGTELLQIRLGYFRIDLLRNNQLRRIVSSG